MVVTCPGCGQPITVADDARLDAAARNLVTLHERCLRDLATAAMLRAALPPAVPRPRRR